MEPERTWALNLSPSHPPNGDSGRVMPQAMLSIIRIPPVIQNPAAGPIPTHHVPWTPVHLWLTLTACPEILWIPLPCSRLRDRKPNTAVQLCLFCHWRVTTETNLGICCKIWHHRTLPGIGSCRLRNHWHRWNLAHTGCSRLSHWCHDIRCTTVWPKPTSCTSILTMESGPHEGIWPTQDVAACLTDVMTSGAPLCDPNPLRAPAYSRKAVVPHDKCWDEILNWTRKSIRSTAHCRRSGPAADVPPNPNGPRSGVLAECRREYLGILVPGKASFDTNLQTYGCALLKWPCEWVPPPDPYLLVH